MPGHLVVVATSQLNQWALDYIGNLQRIKSAVRQAQAKEATILITPELSISGYGLLDHFLELDTVMHSWEIVAELLQDKDLYGIVIDVGLPVIHRGVLFNCRCILLNGDIQLVRPKMTLASEGQFRENRYFTPWPRRYVEDFTLPEPVATVVGKKTVCIGDAILSFQDTLVGWESCEELFQERVPHSDLYLIESVDLGCDGDRLLYDGCAMIATNGDILGILPQFELSETSVMVATIDLNKIRAARISPTRGSQVVAEEHRYKRIDVDFSLALPAGSHPRLRPSEPMEVKYHTPPEEISLGPAVWLYDYLRRSKQSGFFLPLSGGIDSCSSAVICFSMTRLIIDSIRRGNQQVLRDFRAICGEPEGSTWVPQTPQEACNRIFVTAYMGMKRQSSQQTRTRAATLARAIGSFHQEFDMDTVVDSATETFTNTTGLKLEFAGGTVSNLALQNLQARLRMVHSYLYASTIMTARGRKGSLLVLSSSNVDECLRGYYTKYDASSGDLNPIGAISKTDLRGFIGWAEHAFELPCLREFLDAVPTAELTPLESMQTDEEEMGMTYAELSVFGRLRKVDRQGPYSMFQTLLHTWNHLTPREIADKGKFRSARALMKFSSSLWTACQADYNHSTTLLLLLWDQPAQDDHFDPCCSLNPDDNRFDMRPFLLPQFELAYRKLDKEIKLIKAMEEGRESDQI
ncbi:MAG: glutamine-dependent NAD(+) synthetase [Bathelium mastoideum]|nr:MAG: glutamine-dependent NAD(+) synthetase [Bathelium mastoideum]